MGSVTVKVPIEARAKLAEFANEDRRPMGEILAELIERERRRRLFDEGDAAYARLQDDPAAWAEYQEELRSLEGTLLDGLEDDPWVE
jgi:hypothetical protein